MGLFSRALSDLDASLAPGVIKHLQTQGAMQQLSMEIYNDGIELGATVYHRGHEGIDRAMGLTNDPDRARQFILPAIEKKIAVAKAMQTIHEEFDLPRSAMRCRDAYEKWSAFLANMVARANLQLQCYTEWIEHPQIDVSSRILALDQVELRSLDTALNSLNDLIKRAGMAGDAWVALNFLCYNEVRSQMSLTALTPEEFNRRLMEGRATGRVRMFSE